MSVISKEMRDIGISNLRTIGYDVTFGSNIDKRLFHTSGSVGDRIADIDAAVLDPDTHLIMAAFGGYNSNQLLSHINFELYNLHRKQFIGYSDVTALLLGLAKFTEFEIFHGPSFSVFCDPGLSEYTIHGFVNTLSGKPYTYTCPQEVASDIWWLKPAFGPREWVQSEGWKVFRPGIARGKIVGGNLETLSALAGTRYMPCLDNCVLFLEDATGKVPAVFHRCVTHLAQLNIFDNLKGLIIGKPPHGSSLEDDAVMRFILTDVLQFTEGYPVLYDVNCSHIDPMMTIPVGGEVLIDTFDKPRIVINR